MRGNLFVVFLIDMLCVAASLHVHPTKRTLSVILGLVIGGSEVGLQILDENKIVGTVQALVTFFLGQGNGNDMLPSYVK